MKNITLRQLRYVEALARHKHFGDAASAYAISQPALSMQIKELEQTLGVTLFERGPGGVHLTRFGEDFVHRARAILRAVDDLGDLARMASAGQLGQLRLGIIPTIAPYLLPELIRRLTEERRAGEIHVRETQTSTLLEEIAEGRIDAAILALPVSEPGLEELPLFEEEFLLVRPAEEAGLPVPDRHVLREMRLLLLEEGHCFRDQALAFCEAGAARPREGLDANTLSTLVQMVGAGIGVTLIPEMAREIETRSADVAVQRFPAPRPNRTVGMVWRRENPLGPLFRQMAEGVRETAMQLLARGRGREAA